MRGGAGAVWGGDAAGGGLGFARAGGGASKCAAELDSFQSGVGRALSR